MPTSSQNFPAVSNGHKECGNTYVEILHQAKAVSVVVAPVPDPTSSVNQWAESFVPLPSLIDGFTLEVIATWKAPESGSKVFDYLTQISSDAIRSTFVRFWEQANQAEVEDVTCHF